MSGYLYLAGPMTGLPDFNFPAFDAAASRLRAAGATVRSPHELHGGALDLPYATYLEAGLVAARGAAAIVLLPGWESSPGATAEREAAVAAGIPQLHYASTRDETETS